jgi:hypothetical protein
MGFGFFLLLGGAVFACGAYFLVLKDRPRGPGIQTQTTSGSTEDAPPTKIRGLIQQTVAGETVEPPRRDVGTLTSSQRGQDEIVPTKEKETEPEVSQLDTLGRMIRRTPKEPTPLPPVIVEAPEAGTSAPATIPELNMSELIVFQAEKKTETPTPSVPAPEPTGFETGNFLPRGTQLRAVLLSKIETGRTESFVTLGISRNEKFGGAFRLLYGTRLLGTVSQEATRNRVQINVDTILFENGKELPISAVVLDVDQMVGVRGEYKDPPIDTQALPYIARIGNALLAGAISTEQRSEVVSAQGVSIVNQVDVPRQTLPNQLAQAGQDIIRDISSRYVARAVEQNLPYIEVARGTEVIVQLRSAIDLSAARVDGSRDNRQQPAPGFENNPFSPSGQLWERETSETIIQPTPRGRRIIEESAITAPAESVGPTPVNIPRGIEPDDRRIGPNSPVESRRQVLGN